MKKKTINLLVRVEIPENADPKEVARFTDRAIYLGCVELKGMWMLPASELVFRDFLSYEDCVVKVEVPDDVDPTKPL